MVKTWTPVRAWHEIRYCEACGKPSDHALVEDQAEEDKDIEVRACCMSCHSIIRLDPDQPPLAFSAAPAR
jgi:hypothetical protein